MIHLPFSLTKAQQIIDASLKRIENATNIEDKITDIDRTWHQLFGMKSMLESCEIELLHEAAKSHDFRNYKEFTQIHELIYQRMMQVEEMYEKALAQQKNLP